MIKNHELTPPINDRFEIADPSLLYMAVPNMDELLQRKQLYSSLIINTAHPLHDEPLVSLNEYGVSGRSYYSRPNAATGDPVPGVDPAQYLRKSVAEVLSKVNNTLSHPDIIEAFNGEIELYVEDALRPVWLQQKLHDEVMPSLIRQQQPGLNEAEVMEARSHLIAKPSLDPTKPSPHATGGVFDLSLRFKETGDSVNMGHVDADTLRVRPDYFEVHIPISESEIEAQKNRRVFYNIMIGGAFTEPTGFVVNPTEWWHFGKGDQLSEKVRGSDSAYYSFPDDNVHLNDQN